jgi:signal transduction histidine kinase
MNRAILSSVFLAGALALVFGSLIVWRVVRPLKSHTMAASAVAAGDLSQRVSVSSGDEISDLADAFNRMAVQLDRAETLRQQLTADIAHELRTPITVIQGNVEALQDGIFPLTQEALEPILDKTLLLRRLVEDLRQLALAESGQLSLIPEPLDLGHLAGQAIDAFHPPAEARGVELSLAPADSIPLVRADRQRVQQVLDNLLSNALRYTPDGGRITVGLARENESIRVTVTDTGPGIPVEVLPNVFERFYRADQSRERLSDGGGSGLGLAVARSIIEAHGGRIDVKSLPGEGATFWFSLPVDAPEGTG